MRCWATVFVAAAYLVYASPLPALPVSASRPQIFGRQLFARSIQKYIPSWRVRC